MATPQNGTCTIRNREEVSRQSNVVQTVEALSDCQPSDQVLLEFLVGGRSIWLEGSVLVAKIFLLQQLGLVAHPVLGGSQLLG